MRERIGARHLRARCRHLLVRADGNDLHQRCVHRRGWRGIVLHERVHGRGDPVSEHEPSDMRCRGQRLHRLQHHLDLPQRDVHRRAWHGIVLHQRVHGRGDPVSVEQEPSDMRRGGQRLQCLPHWLDLPDWPGLRALRPGRVPGSKLGRVADAQ